MSSSVINTEMVTFGNVLAPMKMGVLCSVGEKSPGKSNFVAYSLRKKKVSGDKDHAFLNDYFSC